MDQDIQFGDVEESRPGVHLRPDRNRQFSVVAYGQIADRDLPIFVELDAMRDMEEHAQSDKSVELGGVLLGGFFEDGQGKPFVVVSESLRAEHYESTKGSFKFTHETWEQITRRREEFPPELQMVGWYHTHPGWSVFLSGPDMFICDNFFNKPLDVALVIDPCQLDRGFFQWTGNPRERVRRTSGFGLFASRHRQQELELFAAQLEGRIVADPRFGMGGPMSFPAPVVNISDQRGNWLGVAVIGMLSLQFLVLVLVGWKLLGGSAEDSVVKRLADSQEAADRLRAQERVLNQVVAELKGTSPAETRQLTDQAKRIEELEWERTTHLRTIKSLDDDLKEAGEKAREASLKAEKDQVETDLKIRGLRERMEKLEATRDNLKAENETLKKSAVGGGWSPWWWLAGGVALGALGAAGAFAGVRRKAEETVVTETKSSPDKTPEP